MIAATKDSLPVVWAFVAAAPIEALGTVVQLITISGTVHADHSPGLVGARRYSAFGVCLYSSSVGSSMLKNFSCLIRMNGGRPIWRQIGDEHFIHVTYIISYNVDRFCV